MNLANAIQVAIWNEFKTYKEVKNYINRWHESNNQFNDGWENFRIAYKNNDYNKEIDLIQTLHNMEGALLLKVAVDLGVDTPDYLPSIPTFKNELKSEYRTAYDTFVKAFKQVETDPSTALGLSNSALESIVKEILKDEKFSSKITGTETTYKLTQIILKEFNLLDENYPKEIKTIGNSLLSVNQAIEKLRSEKTNFHGKTSEDYLINDTIYTYFIINAVTTVGMFLKSYYKLKFPKPKVYEDDNLPF